MASFKLVLDVVNLELQEKESNLGCCKKGKEQGSG